MDFDNVAELVKGMQEYLESHDIRKAGLLEYDAFEVNGDQDPRLKALTDKDRYGEYRRKAIAEEFGENGKCDKLL